jgi:LmeA-like phospholipid-binding
MTAITRSLLTPILQVWLRSQLESAQQLQVKILGSDRQLWQGIIPLAEVSGLGIVYQGLYLSEIELSAIEIKLNVRELLKGESLKLLTAIAVKIDLRLTAADFRQCLTAPLLKDELDQMQVKSILANQTLANKATETEPDSQINAQNDAQIEAFLVDHLQKLGNQFELKHLRVQGGDCYCVGQFLICAT